MPRTGRADERAKPIAARWTTGAAALPRARPPSGSRRTSRSLLEHCAQELALDRRAKAHQPARHGAVGKTQPGGDLPGGVLGFSVLQRYDGAHAGILDSGEQALDQRDSGFPLLRLVLRGSCVESQLRGGEKLAAPRFLQSAAAAQVGGDGEEPAAKPRRFLELRQRGERSQEGLLGQLEGALPVAVARQQALPAD